MLLKTIIYRNLVKYPTHTNLNYMWTFGSLLSLALGLQILSGIFLACYFIPHADHALNSILFIIKEVQGGWFVYRCHVLGSSVIFIALYLHIYRGIYYKLYNWENRYHWWSGYILYLLMMATAFLGYVLPWGQMSFWAATVIINMVTIIPYIGNWLTVFLWGGNSVNTCTLERFFILHFILPFIIAAIVGLHISIIHSNQSTPNYNNKNFNTNRRFTKLTDTSYIDLYPHYIIKDSVTVLIALLGSLLFLIYAPEYFTNYVNWTPANPLVTPRHIVPEWYFLPFYGIIKAIPHKVIGICSMVFLVMFPLALPFFKIKVIK